MKNLIALFLISCFLIMACQAQELYRRNKEDGDGLVRDWYLDDYTDHREVYTQVRGKNHGLWQAIGTDNTVYISGEYMMGVKVGEWHLNYPDGRTRYIVIYDSLGTPMRWTRYYTDKRIITIEREEGIGAQIYSNMLSKEAVLYKWELIQCETKLQNSYGNLGRVYIELNVPNLCYHIDRAAINADEEYFVTTYRYPEDVLYTECLVGNDEEKSKKVYYYKGKRLKKTDYFEFGILKRSETFDKEGNVSKIKKY